MVRVLKRLPPIVVALVIAMPVVAQETVKPDEGVAAFNSLCLANMRNPAKAVAKIRSAKGYKVLGETASGSIRVKYGSKEMRVDASATNGVFSCSVNFFPADDEPQAYEKTVSGVIDAVGITKSDIEYSKTMAHYQASDGRIDVTPLSGVTINLTKFY